MIVRPVTAQDKLLLEKLNAMQTEFKLKNFEHRIIERLAFDDNNPIAYGVVKKMAEAIILINYDAPKASRIRALQELLKWGETGAKMADCEQLHIFVKRPEMADLMCKQFGFKIATNITLVKDL